MTSDTQLPKRIVNGDFDYMWPQLVTHMTHEYNFANVDPAHGDVEAGGKLNASGQASRRWSHIDGFDAAQFGWKSTQTDSYVDGRGGIVEIQRAYYNDNMYAEVTASQAGTAIYQDIDTQHDTPTVYSVSLRYARRVVDADSRERLQVMIGPPGHESAVTMTRSATSAEANNRVGEPVSHLSVSLTVGTVGTAGGDAHGGDEKAKVASKQQSDDESQHDEDPFTRGSFVCACPYEMVSAYTS